MAEQRCVICAWRAHCAKRFSVADGGARCPDFSRDVTVRVESPAGEEPQTVKENKK